MSWWSHILPGELWNNYGRARVMSIIRPTSNINQTLENPGHDTLGKCTLHAEARHAPLWPLGFDGVKLARFLKAPVFLDLSCAI